MPSTYSCVKCGSQIPDGEVLVFNHKPLCSRCAPGGSKPWRERTDPPLDVAPTGLADSPTLSSMPVPGAVSPTPGTTGPESRGPLTLVGLVCGAIGLYFLLNPGVSVDTSAFGTYGGALPDSIANLHKLALGQTFTIVGAIFLAVAWRPR